MNAFRSDEIYGELKKDRAAAQALQDEIESAKLQHPNAKFDESFTSRSAALTARLAVVGDPATSRSFPRPQHPLFPGQGAANSTLTKLLSTELAASAKIIREAAASAARYHDLMHSVNEVERFRDNMVALAGRLVIVTQHLTNGIPSQDGDGSIPNLEDASCLSPTRHGAFLALLPATLKEHDAADEEAQRVKAQCQAIFLKLGAASIDPNLKSGVRAATERLEKQQELAHTARKDIHGRIETMREARNIKASIATVQETTINLRRQITRALQHQRWKPQRVQDGRPLTPESPPPSVAHLNLTPSDAFLQADVLTTQAATMVGKPLSALSPSLGASLSSTLSDMHKSLSGWIEETKRLASLWESVKRQTATMDAVRKEAHGLEADFANLIYRYETTLDFSAEESCAYSELMTREQELQISLDETNQRAQRFIGSLSTRVPFVANSEHSAAFTVSSSSNDDPDAPGRLPFALISLDDSVRADANAYAVSISGSLAVLTKKSNYLKIALLAQDFEMFKQPVLREIEDTSGLIASTRSALDEIESAQTQGSPQTSVLERLTDLESQVNKLVKDRAPRVGSMLSSLRHVLVKMTAAPGASDSFVQERFLNKRSRELERLSAQVESASKELTGLAGRIASSKLLETRRLEAEEAKATAEQRAREEAEERARLEAEIARFAEEERKRKEQEEVRRLEMEKARLEAEEAARRAEEQRLLEVAAEQARIKAEREAELLEQQRLRDEEQARADVEKRRLEAEAEAHREAEAAARRELEENRRREQEMYSKLSEERASRELESRKRRDTETERLVEEAKLRAEVARQEAEIMRLEDEIRKDQEVRKSLDMSRPDEFGQMPSSGSASALVVMSPEGAMEGMFLIFIFPVHVFILRNRLGSIWSACASFSYDERRYDPAANQDY